MKRWAKQNMVLASGAILLSGWLCQTAHATLLNISGISILADSGGSRSAPEALTISWSVIENISDVYTYTYIINNPPGDVLLPGSYSPGTPEIVDTYTLSFNAALPGAVVGSPTGGDSSYNLGSYGLYWSLYPDVVIAGASSGPLSFQSLFAPSAGNASASDDNPPSPWASDPNGDPVPVPGSGNFNVPDSTATIALLSGMLLLLPCRSMLQKKAGRS